MMGSSSSKSEAPSSVDDIPADKYCSGLRGEAVYWDWKEIDGTKYPGAPCGGTVVEKCGFCGAGVCGATRFTKGQMGDAAPVVVGHGQERATDTRAIVDTSICVQVLGGDFGPRKGEFAAGERLCAFCMNFIQYAPMYVPVGEMSKKYKKKKAHAALMLNRLATCLAMLQSVKSNGEKLLKQGIKKDIVRKGTTDIPCFLDGFDNTSFLRVSVAITADYTKKHLQEVADGNGVQKVIAWPAAIGLAPAMAKGLSKEPGAYGMSYPVSKAVLTCADLPRGLCGNVERVQQPCGGHR